MNTLIEFQNKQGDTLRGILSVIIEGDEIVIFVHGLERTAITEKKFTIMVNELLQKNISSLRFDFTGSGLSYGDFQYITVSKITEDLHSAIGVAQKYGKKISVVAHSLGACVVAKYLSDYPDFSFKAIVLLAPALHQKGALRYWYVIGKMRKEDPSIKITWDNYLDYLDEQGFAEDCKRKRRMIKAHYISADYFLENKDLNYSNMFVGKNVLHIHGERDTKVPFASVKDVFKNVILISKGDHDLERPDMREQWVEKAVAFLAK